MNTLPWLDLNAPVCHAPLPNALLLIDPQRGNAQALARYLAQKALCLSEDAPCGQCKSCHLVSQDTHPDLQVYEQACAIDEIRALNAQVQHTPSIGKRRLVILGELDRYLIPSVNALLKTLEEPPEQTHFILSAANRRAVKATVVSRCQMIQVVSPDVEAAEQWLVQMHQWTPEQARQALILAQGDPFRALSASEHPDPAASINECVLFLAHPQHELAYLQVVDGLAKEKVLDSVAAQLRAIITFIQLDSHDEYWHNLLEPHRKAIEALDVHRLHRLYARVCELYRPDRQQIDKAMNIKHCLLEYAQKGAINL
ncbi:DNA polymerase III subunit delta' [Suttonella sp. R2A3]|uniref:DNA polymerase III subunit delta' n=1 Tax=Suttonella sp. R2A3 TaxID=2908648 RepID=UPI001F1ABE76|nr:DNA polymerase III subunit delta' [Suttonella sp. R2A3]UJF24097.1 DNA polymerase III subunit delta' [Suttonella sp. R2A3]